MCHADSSECQRLVHEGHPEAEDYDYGLGCGRYCSVGFAGHRESETARTRWHAPLLNQIAVGSPVESIESTTHVWSRVPSA